MKTFADFKRFAQVGARLEISFPQNPTTPTKIKTINYVQSNAITVRISEDNLSEEHNNRSWFNFPRSQKYYRIENNALVTLDIDGNPYVVLKPVP